ncbi:MAG TPA: hypothetical protein VGR98_17055, partial [Streptosporangiaceae bacterium]|nr:hypothetical protein [Streptosporangiaceae bacterium]
MTGEIEVALTEDFDTAAADQAEDLEVGDADGQAAVMEFDDGDTVDIEGVVEGAVEGAATVDVEVALGAARIQHAARERGRARELFEQLAALPAGDKERQRIRGELVELHLPLVEYLARRFRNRGEWLDDLTQVAT